MTIWDDENDNNFLEEFKDVRLTESQRLTIVELRNREANEKWDKYLNSETTSLKKESRLKKVRFDPNDRIYEYKTDESIYIYNLKQSTIPTSLFPSCSTHNNYNK